MNVNPISPVNEATVQAPARVEPTGETRQTQATENKDIIKNPSLAEKEQTGSVEELKELADSLNDYMDGLQTQLGFFINEDLNNEVIVEIKNRETDELVKQIPSEEMLAIREKMAELTGLLFDGSV